MLKGFSTFTVEIYNKNYIKKSAKNEKDYIRLKKQCLKQKNFENEKYDYIYKPLIYEINDKELYFTMKYLKNTKNFLLYLSNDNLNNNFFFINILKNYFNQIISNSEIKNIYPIFMEKLNNVVDKCTDNDLINQSFFKNIINRLYKHLEIYEKNISIPIGYCHGDLSLSNMLIGNNKVYFIDFLDNFVETILQDIVKIRQDTHIKLILHMNSYTNDILIKKLNIIDKKFHNFFKQYDFYNKYYNIFQILNLIRILPYCTDKNFANLLLNEIHQIIYKLK